MIGRATALSWLAVNTALAMLHLLVPRMRGPLFGEDGIVETTTALLFLAAAFAGLAFLIARRSRRYRTLLVMAYSLGLVGFLDEISFGARLFGWSMPEMPGGGEFDGAHDLVILTYRFGAQVDPIVITAICAGLLLTGLGCTLFWYPRLASLSHRVLTDPAYRLLAVSVGGLATAAILDLESGFLRHLGPLEELVEMNAGLALLLAVRRTDRPLLPTSDRIGTVADRAQSGHQTRSPNSGLDEPPERAGTSAPGLQPR